MHFSLNTISLIASLLLAFSSLFTILSFRKARNLNNYSFAGIFLGIEFRSRAKPQVRKMWDKATLEPVAGSVCRLQDFKSFLRRLAVLFHVI